MPQNNASLCLHVCRGWRSKCCTSSPQTAPWRHIQLWASPENIKRHNIREVLANDEDIGKHISLFEIGNVVKHHMVKMRIWATGISKDGTYRPIQLSFVVHPQVESTVHPSNAYQPNSKAYEFQNTWRRITQLFCTDFDKDERRSSKNLIQLWQQAFGKFNTF